MERLCPKCNKPNIRKSRESGWYCWTKTGGCGAVYRDGDAAIEGQAMGQKPNPDVADTVNTILKMAMKRAKISATINAISASEFFTQDVEDFTVADEIDTGGHPRGTQAAANHVAEQKLATGNLHSKAPWKNMRELAECMQAMRRQAGDTAWLSELERFGWRGFQDLRNAIDNKSPNAMQKATEIYWHLDALVRKEVA